MSEAKPTPGPWFVVPYGRTGVGHLVCVLNSMHKVCADVPVSTNSEGDANLIADAGTVFHTTGLTPSQLVERVKELEEVAADFMEAQAALDNREGMGINAEPYEVLMHRRNRAWDDLEAALSKARKQGGA